MGGSLCTPSPSWCMGLVSAVSDLQLSSGHTQSPHSLCNLTLRFLQLQGRKSQRCSVEGLTNNSMIMTCHHVQHTHHHQHVLMAAGVSGSLSCKGGLG